MTDQIEMWLAEATQLHKVDDLLSDEEIYASQMESGKWRAYWISTTQTYGGSWGGPDAHYATKRRVFRDGDGKIIQAETVEELEDLVIALMREYDYLPTI